MKPEKKPRKNLPRIKVEAKSDDAKVFRGIHVGHRYVRHGTVFGIPVLLRPFGGSR